MKEDKKERQSSPSPGMSRSILEDITHGEKTIKGGTLFLHLYTFLSRCLGGRGEGRGAGIFGDGEKSPLLITM